MATFILFIVLVLLYIVVDHLVPHKLEQPIITPKDNVVSIKQKEQA